MANSLALERAAIGADTAAPVGGVIEHDRQGRPNGLLHETAIGLVKRVMPGSERRRGRGDDRGRPPPSTVSRDHLDIG